LASIIGCFGLIYVPGKLIVTGDATATATHIRASKTLFRLGIASELFGFIMFIFVVLALYRLVKDVNERHALAMAILLLVSIPISLVNVLNDIAALVLVSGVDFLSVVDKGQLDALAYLFVRLHGQGFVLAQIFWGLGYFVRDLSLMGFIPRFLGYLLFIAGSGYSAAHLLILPAHGSLLTSSRWSLELRIADNLLAFDLGAEGLMNQLLIALSHN
jgi:hypothetical protein